MPPVIELVGLRRTYGEGDGAVHALHPTDLVIAERDFVAVMGPSGSGKSTLVNIIGCLDRQTGGRYLFEGHPVETLTRAERALLRRHAFGFVFQGFNLLARTSAVENVELPLIYRGEGRRRRRDAAMRALDTVGLADRAHHNPAKLSGGQQQRVAIARAIVTRPHVLLADEPTGNLDSARSREIMGLLRSLSDDHGMTVIVVTHESEMAAYASRTVTVRDGRVASDVGISRP